MNRTSEGVFWSWTAADPRLIQALELELGERVIRYLDIENSDWAYKCWWASCRWWWDAASKTFVEETRPEMLRFANLGRK